MKRQQQAARGGGDSIGSEVLPAWWLPHPQGHPLCKGMKDSSFVIVPKALQLGITLYNSLREKIPRNAPAIEPANCICRSADKGPRKQAKAKPSILSSLKLGRIVT